MDSNKIAIDGFWDWFAGNAEALAGLSVPDSTVAELEQRLFEIRRLDWELGPGVEQPHMFALSPRGEAADLALTRQIIAAAPVLPGWELHPAKPRKQWALELDMSSNGVPYHIDGKRWEVVLYRFNDGLVDVVLKPDADVLPTPELLSLAATIIVDGELGEEVRMTTVNKVEVVAAWDDGQAIKARKLEPGLLHRLIG